MPPNVNSPFLIDVVVVGSKDTARRSAGIVPWKKRLSVTVGTEVVESGDKVPIVKSSGPSLQNKVSAKILSDGASPHPRTPSKPWKPDDDEATPIDWLWTTRVGLSVTVSKNSLPEEEGKGV